MSGNGPQQLQAWALSWNFKSFLKFTPCPEFFCRCETFEYTCKWCISAWVHKHLYQFHGVDAPAHVSLRPNCGPWKLKAVLKYSYCDTAEGTKQTAHLYYWLWVTTVFLDDFNDTLSCLHGFVLKTSFPCPENNFNCTHACKEWTRSVSWPDVVQGD